MNWRSTGHWRQAGVEFTNGDKPGVRLVGPAEVRVIAEGKSKVTKKRSVQKHRDQSAAKKKVGFPLTFSATTGVFDRASAG